MLAACGDGSPSEPPFTVVSQNQPSALLSAWGTSATDVWVVGGDPRDGTGPIVEHYDGAAWTKVDTGQRNVDLWWVHGFDDGSIFMSGSGGTILRYRSGAFEKMTTPGNLIAFGLWGASSTDVWAVGGNAGGSGGAFVWRYDGNAWTAFAGLPADLASQGTCWKVGGRAANDVWISGTTGTTLHWNGSTLERTNVPVQEGASLFSVAGNAERFIAVGGSFAGELYENTGTGWTSALPVGGPPLTGVAISDDDAYAVGQFGAVLHRGTGDWTTETPRATTQNLHGAWIDPSGGVWAVGGQFDSKPMTAGVLIHKGTPSPATF